MDRLCVFLNGDRGVAALDALIGAGHGVSHVFLPDGRQDSAALAPLRGRSEFTFRPVKDVNAADFVAELRALQPALSIVAGYSTIFQQALIGVPTHGTVNLHAGRLPGYRGGSPLNWQILNGDDSAGISVIQMDTGIDTGDVLAEAELPIGPDDTIADLHTRANQVFPELVLAVIDAIASGNLERRVQNDEQACYWHQRNDADGRIDWAGRTARDVHNLIRAITRPYPGAHTRLGDLKVRIRGSALLDFALRGVPGRVVWLQGRGPYVVCRDRAILITDYAAPDRPEFRLPHGAQLS